MIRHKKFLPKKSFGLRIAQIMIYGNMRLNYGIVVFPYPVTDFYIHPIDEHLPNVVSYFRYFGDVVQRPGGDRKHSFIILFRLFFICNTRISGLCRRHRHGFVGKQDLFQVYTMPSYSGPATPKFLSFKISSMFFSLHSSDISSRLFDAFS